MFFLFYIFCRRLVSGGKSVLLSYTFTLASLSLFCCCLKLCRRKYWCCCCCKRRNKARLTRRGQRESAGRDFIYEPPIRLERLTTRDVSALFPQEQDQVHDPDEIQSLPHDEAPPIPSSSFSR